MAPPAAPLRLITVRFSHYCEKARWALDRAGLAYREESHVPIISWPATIGAGGGRTVPVLVTPGKVLADSTEILRWLDGQSHAPPLFPAGAEGREVAEWEDDFDRHLGPATRRLIYTHVLPQRELTLRLLGSAGGRWQRRLLRAIFPLLRQVMVKGLRITPAAGARSARVVEDTFARVSARLADGRRYLVGDRMTAADLTFASLATPVLVPDEFAPFLPPKDAFPPGVHALIESYRATPAGAYALRLYAEERTRALC